MDGNPEKTIFEKKRIWQNRLSENDKKFLSIALTQINGLIKIIQGQILQGSRQAWENVFFITADAEIPTVIQEFLNKESPTENLKFLQELMRLNNLQIRSKYSDEPLSLQLKLQNLQSQLLFLS